jgi:hypothetical protein
MVASTAMQMKPGTASHLLRKFIRESEVKASYSIGFVKKFTIDQQAEKCPDGYCGARCALVLQTSCLPLSDALDRSHDLDENRSQQSELS